MARDARAFCRTTTCDPTEERDGCAQVLGCSTRGQTLFWPDACVTYAVHLLGSPLRKVSAFETDQAMQNAFRAWLGTTCPGGGQPSLGVVPLGGASCDRVEFNAPEAGRAGAPNANLVIFRDSAWPYPDERFVIARTSITFETTTGVIFDADIEINSFQNEFSTSDTEISYDLQAVLTHEVGHFLGLDHSRVPNATMNASYDVSSLGTRTLSSDDQAAICSVYSPLADPSPGCPGDTGPLNGFSRECGSDSNTDAACLALAPGAARDTPWLAGGALSLLALSRRRQRWPR
jgi:matrixin